MAIRVRRGNYADFDKNKLVSGELGLVLDRGELHFCYSPGNTKKLQTAEDLQNLLNASPEAYSALQSLLNDLSNNPSELTNILNNISALQTGKLDKTGDTSANTATFEEAEEDVDIATGDTHATIFGKILKSIKTLRTNIENKLDKAAVGVEVASLGEDGKVPNEQLPEIASSADKINYDNTNSGLSATNTQDAMDELSAVKVNKTDIVQTDTVNDTTKIPSAAVTYALGQEIDEINNNLGDVSSQLAQIANYAEANYAKKTEVTNVMTPKGTIAYASLPVSGNEVGWYYYCPDGDGTNGPGNYVWNGTEWYFGGTGDEGYSKLKSDLYTHEEAIGYDIVGPSTNIFDKDVKIGYTLNLYIGSTIDNIIENDKRSVWNKILDVNEGDMLYYNKSWIYIGFYNNDGIYVSKVNDENFSCVVPNGASKCRIAINTTDVDCFMISVNTPLPSEYEEYSAGGKVLHDLSDIPSDVMEIKSDVMEIKSEIEEIKNKLPQESMRVAIVSDLHLHSADMMLTNYGGISHSERMKILVDSLNAEHRKKKFNAVIFNGDYSLGHTKNDAIYFAKHFLPQLEMDYHVFPGDHDVVTNEEWLEIFGTNRQYTVNLGNYAFIFLDGYYNTDDIGPTGAINMAEFDQNYCEQEITKAIASGLTPIILMHFDAYFYKATKDYRATIRERCLCAFTSHSHEITTDDIGYGWPAYQTGNFSYPNGADYSNFGDNGENRWGFRICEISDNKLVTYMCYPTQTLTISNVNNGEPLTYDYTKDDDNEYGSFFVIKDYE